MLKKDNSILKYEDIFIWKLQIWTKQKLMIMIKKIVLTYGLIAGLIVAAMMAFSFSGSNVDFTNGELIGYATMIIAFSTIFIAIKSHRDKNLDGYINFQKAFKIGLGITLVATLIYVVSWMIISNTIAKDFMTEYYQHSVEKLKASDLSEAQIEAKIAEMDRLTELYKNPIVKIGMTFLEIFPVGFIISLISALILKRKASSPTPIQSNI